MPMTTLRLADAPKDPHARRALNALSMTVAKSKKIVVITGAGISCSCGIPDFRSADGLYALVKSRYPNTFLKGRDLFSSTLFRDPASTALFYTFISQLKQSIDKAAPGPTHDFLKTLDLKGKLLRSYTQNIDGMEEAVGLVGTSTASGSGSSSSSSSGRSSPNSEEGRTANVRGGSRKGKMSAKELKSIKNVQLHGTVHRVRCTFCSADFEFLPEYADSFNEGVPPDCPECSARSSARILLSRRPLKVGNLRPSMVLYDEPHPQSDLIALFQESDMRRKPDMIIVMGTSLKVYGLKRLLKEFAKVAHGSAEDKEREPKVQTDEQKKPTKTSSTRLSKSEKLTTPATSVSTTKPPKVLFINKTAPSPMTEWEGIIDCWVEGETDEWVKGVEETWRKGRPQDWEVQGVLDGEVGVLKARKVNVAGVLGEKAKKEKAIAKKSKDVVENVPPEPKTDTHAAIDLTKSPTKKRAAGRAAKSSKSTATAVSLPSTQSSIPTEIVSLISTQESTRDVAEVLSLPPPQESLTPSSDAASAFEDDIDSGFTSLPPSSPLSSPPSSPMSIVLSPPTKQHGRVDIMSIVMSSPPRLFSPTTSPLFSPLSSPRAFGSSGSETPGTPGKRRKDRRHYQGNEENGRERADDSGTESGVESSPSKRRAAARYHGGVVGGQGEVEVEVERRLLFGPSRRGNINLNHVSTQSKNGHAVERKTEEKKAQSKGEMDMSVDIDLKDLSCEKENKGRRTRSAAKSVVPQTLCLEAALEVVAAAENGGTKNKARIATRPVRATRAKAIIEVMA